MGYANTDTLSLRAYCSGTKLENTSLSTDGKQGKKPKMAGRYKKLVVLFLGAILLLTGCAGNGQKDSFTDKTYLYEKDGIGGDFTIQIKSDGTFSYYEGYLSSHIGMGEWKQDGSTLILLDNTMEEHPLINYFEIDGNTLIFRAEGSDNFIYIKVSDGEKFFAE